MLRLALIVAVLSCLVVAFSACDEEPPFAGDVPIAWEDREAGPNFWACLVATPDFAADAEAMAAVLTPLQGYGDAHVRVLADQGGSATAPTWDNIRECIAFLRASASAGDVAIFYVSTHGARGCAPSVSRALAPWRAAGDETPLDEPTEGPGDEVFGDRCDDLSSCCPAPGEDGPRDGWILTGVGEPTLGDVISDDELAAEFAEGFAAGVGFVGIFDQCFAGEQADGEADIPAVLAAAGTPHALLMSSHIEESCPVRYPGSMSYFTDSLVDALKVEEKRGCSGGVTRDADANGDCITTAVELFNASTCKCRTGPFLENHGSWSNQRAVDGTAESDASAEP